MTKHLLQLVYPSALLSIALGVKNLHAQEMTELTVPDYSYGDISANYGLTSSQGVAKPGPNGSYDFMEHLDEKPHTIFLGYSYRWWGYPSYPLMICGKPLLSSQQELFKPEIL